MPQQHVLAIEAVPVVQVPLLPRLAAQAAPHDAVADPELARQRRPRRRVTERIGRVEHVESSAPPLRVGRAQQQVAHQRFAGRDLLVGEHVPRTHLQPARLHESDVRALVKTGRLQVGPWYVLADEQIPSGEALVRNLLLGAADAERWGGRLDVLYSPDAFGHPAAWPTLAREFGIRYGGGWRGLGGEPR